MLPFFALLLAAGVDMLARRRGLVVAVAGTALLLGAQCDGRLLVSRDGARAMRRRRSKAGALEPAFPCAGASDPSLLGWDLILT